MGGTIELGKTSFVPPRKKNSKGTDPFALVAPIQSHLNPNPDEITKIAG
jgi:hypothetical protein